MSDKYFVATNILMALGEKWRSTYSLGGDCPAKESRGHGNEHSCEESRAKSHGRGLTGRCSLLGRLLNESAQMSVRSRRKQALFRRGRPFAACPRTREQSHVLPGPPARVSDAPPRSRPGLVAVITLALGIGANTAIFSVIYSVLLKPLAFPEAERIVQVWMAFPERGINRTSWSHGNFWDARDMTQAFEELGAVEFGDVNLTGHGDPAKLDAVRVNAGFFRVLGVAPVVGRLLRQGDDDPGMDANVVILSHRIWRGRFGGDPAVVGRTLMLNGQAHQVIGILPAGTPFLDYADAFRPLVRTANAQRGSWELFGVGRLKPGVTLEAARADLQRVARVLAERHPKTNLGMSANIGPVTDLVAGESTRRPCGYCWARSASCCSLPA